MFHLCAAAELSLPVASQEELTHAKNTLLYYMDTNGCLQGDAASLMLTEVQYFGQCISSLWWQQTV